ncbi:MAG: hypothetical protein WCL57_09195 [Chloroflexota bacterium]
MDFGFWILDSCFCIFYLHNGNRKVVQGGTNAGFAAGQKPALAGVGGHEFNDCGHIIKDGGSNLNIHWSRIEKSAGARRCGVTVLSRCASCAPVVTNL